MKRSSHPYCVLGGCSFLRFDEKIEMMGHHPEKGVMLSGKKDDLNMKTLL